ncbi:putative PTS IIA-like nitrogen-regulatory protein PtsN [Thermodesulfatator indicus DSM 15286]|uniref:PTS IIA-like nitrogen-regulatory protein PtsN n=1 Tax=Thermodesulfatator indicus (strain DSM 15286 / JCM 11887 / CIR29812) TaxID=667014 RepID=F8A9N9_THEID|nr:PTS sugar transporter subunit IIA [Thermodesulfatator indicus]AEH45270.1 putative PTS IIA-like nitrogen-regulatory protein PtsN [Thermodesulfatator indicus DSM 15286]
MKIRDLLLENCFFTDVNVKDKWQFFKEISACIAKEVGLSPEKIEEALVEREKLGTTAVGGGIAIPHSRVEGLEKIVIAAAISRKGLDFEALDKKPVYLIFVVLAPENESSLYLKTLAQLARILKQEQVKKRLLEAKDIQEFKKVLAEIDYEY